MIGWLELAYYVASYVGAVDALLIALPLAAAVALAVFVVLNPLLLVTIALIFLARQAGFRTTTISI